MGLDYEIKSITEAKLLNQVKHFTSVNNQMLLVLWGQRIEVLPFVLHMPLPLLDAVMCNRKKP